MSVDPKTAQAFQRLQVQFQEEAKKAQEIEEKVGVLNQNLAKINTQINECKMVEHELNLVHDDQSVYKLMGPVLVKQETFEAKTTIESRLKYLAGEESRISADIKEHEQQMAKSRETINDILQKFQKMQQDIQQQAQKAQQQAQKNGKGGKK